MSDHELAGVYAYQPFGSVTHRAHNEAGRLWGVGGLPILATCVGLTREEAAAIVCALTPTVPAPIPPDPARAEFVARVREEYREGWTGKGATPLKRIMWVLEEVPATYEYVRLHGWPSTLRAIAEALDEEPK